MRIVVIGATGNIGTALLEQLADLPGEVVAVARRPPSGPAIPANATFVAADAARDDLAPVVAGADAVVHLAWALQPAHEPARLAAANVAGARAALEAARAGGVRRIVVVSSIAAYEPGPADRFVDETWPIGGVESSSYSRQKAAVERLCDLAEAGGTSVVRLRPAFVFQRPAARAQLATFAGRALPPGLLRPRWPFIPFVRGTRLQAVHAADVATAIRLALRAAASGAYNVVAPPPLGMHAVAACAARRVVPIPPGLARAGYAAGFRLRLVASEPGWLDLARHVPWVDAGRIRRELGWQPRYSAYDAIESFVSGARDGDRGATPPLADGPADATADATAERKAA